MNDRDRRSYDMFQRVTAFMTENANEFKNSPVAVNLIAALNDEILKIAALGEEKMTDTAGAKDASIFRGDMREDLRDAMLDITAMWRTMADEHQNAENKFRMPRNSNDQNLVDAAGSFAVEALPLQANFVARGMDADFIAQLEAKTAAFAASIRAAETARRERVGTNAGFGSPITIAQRSVEKLDPIVKMKYRANPQMLAQWLVASHTERAPKRKKTPPPVK